MKNMDTIAVLDFGGQYAHLIANRVRRLGVFTEIHSPNAPVSELEGVKGIIYSGGPSSVYAADAPEYNPEILSLPVPKLGICYGHQLLAFQQGGKVQPGKVKEYGIADLKVLEPADPIFDGVPQASPMWMSHGDSVSELPAGYKIIASTDDCPIAAVACPEKRLYGFQFHPEVTHSRFGMKVLENFVKFCGCEKSWNMKSYLPLITSRIREQVGNRKVFLLVSGGVDSTVAFVLLNRVLGPQKVLGLHIDNGMMRLNESQKIVDFLKAEGMDNLKVCDASEKFLEKLRGVTAPETKRGIIGREFLVVKDDEMAKLHLDPNEWMMAQGTIYPDTIESGGTKNADKIKTHHNRVQEVLDLMEKGLVLEPLADLYKDEVRALGEELGIPHHLVWRHPFPARDLGCACFAAREKSAKKLCLRKTCGIFPGNRLPNICKKIKSTDGFSRFEASACRATAELMRSRFCFRLPDFLGNGAKNFPRNWRTVSRLSIGWCIRLEPSAGKRSLLSSMPRGKILTLSVYSTTSARNFCKKTICMKKSGRCPWCFCRSVCRKSPASSCAR